MGKSAGRFGDWLRRELDRRGYTGRGATTRFANAAGVHLSIVSRILNEDRVPEIDALRKIGNALGIPLGAMLVHAGLATPDELNIGASNTVETEPLPPDEEPELASMTTAELIQEFKDPSPVARAMLQMLQSMDNKIAELDSKVNRLAPTPDSDQAECDPPNSDRHRGTA